MRWNVLKDVFCSKNAWVGNKNNRGRLLSLLELINAKAKRSALPCLLDMPNSVCCGLSAAVRNSVRWRSGTPRYTLFWVPLSRWHCFASASRCNTCLLPYRWIHGGQWLVRGTKKQSTAQLRHQPRLFRFRVTQPLQPHHSKFHVDSLKVLQINLDHTRAASLYLVDFVAAQHIAVAVCDPYARGSPAL